MLSTMREKTKIIMLVLAVAFVGWLVFDVGMGATGRGQYETLDIGSVDGTPIRYQVWQEAFQEAYDQVREQNPGVSFTREDVRSLEDDVFERLVQQELLRREYRRRGIVVTDREVADALRRFPPPEITENPQFQTEGRFDPQKYERFLATPAASREYLLVMERRYRDELPRLKLLEQVTSDIYVSDAKLWRMWRDQRDSVTVRALVIRPEQAVADASVTVTPEDLRAYYGEHREEFRRPAVARVSFVAISKLPTAADSAEIFAFARQLRDSILRGADFAELARAESADSANRENGGDLGTFGRGQMTLAFEEAAFRTPVGAVSEPVLTPFGVHLIKVERKTRDSVAARHILIPLARRGARLDTLEARADSLDRYLAEQANPAVFDSIARLMGLPVTQAPPLIQGQPYTLGRYRIPDVGIWAFEAQPGESSPVIEVTGGYYVFRLDSMSAEGVPPLEEVEAQVAAGARRQKKRAAAERIARDAESRLNSGQSLDQVAQALRLPIMTLGPITRTSSAPLLGSASEAVGVAFRLRVGERSRLLSNEEGFFVLESGRMVRADSASWEAQRNEQRLSVLRAARQLRVQSYLDALRRGADVKDRRDQVLRPTAADQQLQ
jgi:peptidyl-prolyl cis-trans isomerase D